MKSFPIIISDLKRIANTEIFSDTGAPFTSAFLSEWCVLWAHI